MLSILFAHFMFARHIIEANPQLTVFDVLQLFFHFFFSMSITLNYPPKVDELLLRHSLLQGNVLVLHELEELPGAQLAALEDVGERLARAARVVQAHQCLERARGPLVQK